jgi:hypothetical protein
MPDSKIPQKLALPNFIQKSHSIQTSQRLPYGDFGELKI